MFEDFRQRTHINQKWPISHISRCLATRMLAEEWRTEEIAGRVRKSTLPVYN
jgi:arginyl-tRNA--protein-N-Asp/Glu arginylyltransferase